MGFKLTLVNPYQIKQMPGRKSDIKDAQWIATLLHKGLIRGSFVPPHVIQELRVYSRKHDKLKQQVTRILTIMDSIPVKSGIRASSCLSSINSKSFMSMVESLIAGRTDPDYLVSPVYGNRKNKQSGKLKEALTGNVKAHHRQELSWAKQEYDLCQVQITQCLSKMQRICDFPDERFVFQGKDSKAGYAKAQKKSIDSHSQKDPRCYMERDKTRSRIQSGISTCAGSRENESEAGIPQERV